MTRSVWNKSRLKPYALAVIPLLLIAGAVTLSSHVEEVFAEPVDGVQTLVFMRHAEKPADGLGQLNCQGLNRAIDLATLLPQRYGNADFIFAADPSRQVEEGADDDAYNYVRPLMTINPSAIKLGLPINLEFATNDTRALAKELTGDKYHNATIYTAWSHGYLPELINDVAGQALGKKTTLTEDWAASDFDSLYVLTLTWHNGKATLLSRVDQQDLNNGAKACPT
ncbi:MAG: histidine phosphatase family protein [Pseudomonadota bacterium]